MVTRSHLQAFRNHIDAMRDPLRHRCWLALNDREIASPKEIADTVGAPLDKVSYHVKRLVELGCAEFVDERPVRGVTIQHFYRAIEPVLIDGEDWLRLLEEEPGLADYALASFMQNQVDDFTGSVRAGVLGSDEMWHVTRTPGLVDQQGLEEALALAEETRERFGGIVQRAAERRSESGEEAINMSACLSFFKTPKR
jgi:hypothetical protein